MWKRLGSVPAGAGNRRPALQQHLSPGEWRPSGRDDGENGGDDNDENYGGDNDDDNDAQVDQQLESAQQLVAQRRSNSPQRPYPVRPKNRVRFQISETVYFGGNRNPGSVIVNPPCADGGFTSSFFSPLL